MKTYKEVLDYLRSNNKSMFWTYIVYSKYHTKIRVLITNLRHHLK